MNPATDDRALCDVLQNLGLPAFFVESVGRQVTAYNPLFCELVGLPPTEDCRTAFSDQIWTRLSVLDQNRWRDAIASGKPIVIFFRSGVTGENLQPIWAAPRNSEIEQAVLCVVFTSGSPIEREELIAKGRELERQRLKQELHANFAQELLGAAFGAKLLADKMEQGHDRELAQSASTLTSLLNRMAERLPGLTKLPPAEEQRASTRDLSE
jgi:signal transduction histidine kinase